MAVYDRTTKKLITIPQNTVADEAAKKAAADWTVAHADDVKVLPTYDEKTGRQSNYFDRSEVVVCDEPTFKITAMSDGTIRKDNRQPPAPKPAPITAATTWSYSPEQLAQLHNKEKASVQVSDAGMKVTEQEPAKKGKNWLDPSPREEFGDNFKRP